MEIMFIVMPLKYMSMSVTNTEIGIESPMINVLFRERRNINKTATARSAP